MNDALKQVIIVWFSIYPLITVIQYIFGEMLSVLPLPVRTFILTVVLVPLMVFVFIPFWGKLLAPILGSSQKNKAK